MTSTAQQGRRYATTTPVDFVVIGSGPAGGSVARELSRRGHSVVVLEQGAYESRATFKHDELAVFFNGKYLGDPDEHVQTYRKTPAEKAVRRPFLMYAKAVGGSSLHYTANYWRFRPIDFVEYSRKGSVDGAVMADWPITYDDLEPYYTAVEWALGVSGQGGADPDEGRRSRPYPLPPHAINGPGALLEVGAKKMGWRALPAPMAILSRPYKGREACHGCGWCLQFPCEWGAKSGTNFTMIPEALATGRCELRTHAKARKIEVDARGRVTGVVYFDGRRREVLQRAKAVVVCANGGETPRLLLMSKSNLFPDGLANSSGLVGKYLMFNSNTGVEALYTHEVNGHRGPPVTRICLAAYEMDPSLGIYGGGGWDFRQILPPIAAALNVVGEGPTWGAGFKQRVRHGFARSLQVFGHGTTLPQETNRIDLDPDAKDAWGLPAIRTTYNEHANDMKLMKYLIDRSVDLAKAAGAVATSAPEARDDPGSGVHLLGTCRMGNDPRASVVNADHRAHDVPNLFIVDGSSFVSSGRGQPTLTIQALAFRAADRISQLAKRGDLQG